MARLTPTLSATLALALCAASTHRAPAAHAQGAAAPSADPAPSARPAHPADVRFMQGMVGHHAQALTMTALAPERAASPAVRLLAERIAVSQRDEIAQMARWLARHAPPAPTAPHTGHGPHAASRDTAHDTAHDAMPGMLTAAELAALGRLQGAAFDRAFLGHMIRHHEGALTMVATLLATPGAAQDPESWQVASDVDADQRAEIRRMRALLATLTARPPA